MDPKPSEVKRPSLRTRLLWRVLPPLALTWIFGSLGMLAIAYTFAQKALDRSLLDDAYALAANVSSADGAPVLNLSEREIGAVLFDQSEKVFFSLLRSDGTFVAGHGGLREGPPPRDAPWEFADRHTRGLDLRTVTLRREHPTEFVVVVAQTVSSRNQLLQQLVMQSLVPQVVLLVLLGIWLRRSVALELEPLTQLQREVDGRAGSDLAPVKSAAPSREVQRLADAVNRLLGRVRAGVQAQREFTGNVAHELRTPLAGIRSLAEHALAQTDPQQWRAQLQRVLQSEQRASHLIDQLLALALADETRDTLVLEPLALDRLVRDFVLRHMAQADSLGIDLGASGLDEPTWAWGQAALIEGVLGNLLDNAIKYTPNGGEVTVTAKKANGSAELGTWKIVVIGRAAFGNGTVEAATQLADLVVVDQFHNLTFDKAACEQGQATEMVVKVEKKSDFEGEAKAAPVRAPTVGQHSEAVLRQAGYSAEEISRLRGLGVLQQP